MKYCKGMSYIHDGWVHTEIPVLSSLTFGGEKKEEKRESILTNAETIGQWDT